MQNALKSTVKSILRTAGLIKDLSPSPHIKRILNGHPMLGADVGAAGWLPETWQSLEGGIHFLFFEPHPESHRKLLDRVKLSKDPHSISVIHTALSGTGGKRTLHLLHRPTGSSLLPVDMDSEFVDEADPYIFPIREAEIDTQTLAEVLNEQHASLHILKLDVQGAELEILNGLGQERRDELVMVEAEVNMAGGVYLGCPTFNDIKEVLTSADLRLYDVNVVKTFRKNQGNKFWYHEHVFDVYNDSPSIAGRTWEFDVVYFKDYRTLMDRGDGVQIRRLLVALCAYGFFSEAYFIAQSCEQEKIVDKAECDALLESIVGWHNDFARKFWYGRNTVMRWMRSVLNAAH